MSVENIEYEGIVLARHIKTCDMKEGLDFFSKDEEFIQVGSWSYNKGKELLAHVHNEVERTVTKTQEVLVVFKGKIEAKIYNLEECLVDKKIICAGEILILLNGAHGYSILEDGTQVIEIKNGPYLGAEVDRRRI